METAITFQKPHASPKPASWERSALDKLSAVGPRLGPQHLSNDRHNAPGVSGVGQAKI